MFSDSTQEAKGEGRKKEIGSTSKNYYFKQVAQAIFANDPNTELMELSQSHPDEFVSRITRHFRDLHKLLQLTWVGSVVDSRGHARGRRTKDEGRRAGLETGVTRDEGSRGTRDRLDEGLRL